MTEIGFRSYSRHIDAYPCPSLAICYDFERDINNFLCLPKMARIWGHDMFSSIRTNLSKDEAKSSSICDDIRKIIQISFPEGARTWQVYHRWSVPSNTFWKNARTFWPVRRAVLSDRGNSVELICSKRWSLAG